MITDLCCPNRGKFVASFLLLLEMQIWGSYQTMLTWYVLNKVVFSKINAKETNVAELVQFFYN